LEFYCSAYASAGPNIATGGAPQLEFNYGVGEDVQLSVSPQMAFASPRNASGDWGLGDTELGVKLRFLHEGDSHPEAAFYPQVVLPSGKASEGLGNGAAQAFLPFWFQKSWGPWTDFGGGGYWFNPGVGNKNWTFLGDALQKDIGDRFSVGGELFFHSADQCGESGGLGSNLALLLHLDPARDLVFSGGRDLVGPTTFTGYAGFRWVL
jgi:hypothetical protein